MSTLEQAAMAGSVAGNNGIPKMLAAPSMPARAPVRKTREKCWFAAMRQNARFGVVCNDAGATMTGRALVSASSQSGL